MSENKAHSHLAPEDDRASSTSLLGKKRRRRRRRTKRGKEKIDRRVENALSLARFVDRKRGTEIVDRRGLFLAVEILPDPIFPDPDLTNSLSFRAKGNSRLSPRIFFQFFFDTG